MIVIINSIPQFKDQRVIATKLDLFLIISYFLVLCLPFFIIKILNIICECVPNFTVYNHVYTLPCFVSNLCQVF